MNIVVKRCALKPTYTIGKLYIDGVFFCHTLEDCDRGLSDSMSLAEIKRKKIYGQTAIPLGTYEIDMKTKSPKYSKKENYASITNGGYMPRLKDVKGWSGVLLHGANSAEDVQGCIGVGENTIVGRLTKSFNTFKKLYPLLVKATEKAEKITLTIERR